MTDVHQNGHCKLLGSCQSELIELVRPSNYLALNMHIVLHYAWRIDAPLFLVVDG